MEIEAVYSLPFDATRNPVRISQGRNGPWSHFGFREAAVDFALPLETPVIATRAGEILKFNDSGTVYYEGLDPEIGDELSMRIRTNFVKILHEETTEGQIISMYSHLAQGSVVRKGHFEAGEVIAYTGKSGWIGGIPHLHFEVHRVNNTLPPITPLAIEFSNYVESLDHETLAKQGKIYFG